MKTFGNMISRMQAMTASKRQKGAAIIEYVLLAALIGVALIASFGTLKEAISTKFSTIGTELNAAGTTSTTSNTTTNTTAP